MAKAGAKAGSFDLKSLFSISAWEFDLALRYLRTKRKDGGIALIAIISFVGIMLAVAVLIIVMSVMGGFRDELVSRLVAFNGHAYVYGAPLTDWENRDETLKRLEAIPGVNKASPYIESPGLAQGPHSQAGLAYMRGVDAEALKNTDIIRDNIKQGSFEGFGEGDFGGDLILIGEGLARSMSVNAGDELTLLSPSGSTAFGAMPRRKAYTIGGVFKSGVSELDAAFVFMPIEQAQLFFDREGEWDVIEIKVDDPYHIANYHQPLMEAAGQGALVQDWTQRNAAMWNALQVERNVMRLILMLIIMIAAMNIISGIVMLVKNKTRDIAILRTFGADRASITRVFFLSGSIIGAGGTLTGLVVGTLFCIFIQPIQKAVEYVFNVKVFNEEVYYLAYIPAKVEVSEVAIIVVFAMLSTCVATLFPALWASKLEPVEALRNE
ncbi:lipoprotein-releasing ABC transporter permease subunit [Asticcacaulis tiandongensis]|uniref:lipoprotein-releasing ABC transporter permease subunit n=1 Tax=Asticcacaulis tiandongensis TaxID=2565365 RepID=UPI00112B7D86|nr:lipoprotein-releasing ABC transporter permease subunit [Asticcacaulis tiandongensis]